MADSEGVFVEGEPPGEPLRCAPDHGSPSK